MTRKEYAIEKLRNMVSWANWQNEDINYRIKNIKDFETVYNFICKSDYSNIETLYGDDRQEYKKLCKKLGYELL